MDFWEGFTEGVGKFNSDKERWVFIYLCRDRQTDEERLDPVPDSQILRRKLQLTRFLGEHV